MVAVAIKNNKIMAVVTRLINTNDKDSPVSVVVSDSVDLAGYVDKTTDQTVGGVKTFSSVVKTNSVRTSGIYPDYTGGFEIITDDGSPAGVFWTFTGNGSIIPQLDNSYDIGYSLSNSPRNVRAGTSFYSPKISDIGGSLTVNIGASDRWVYDSAGVFYPSTDNINDIGKAANGVKTLFVNKVTISKGTVVQHTNTSTAVTIDKSAGTIQTTPNLTAAGASFNFVVNNSLVQSDSVIVVSVFDVNNQIVSAFVSNVAYGVGQFVITVVNQSAIAFNGSQYINFIIV